MGGPISGAYGASSPSKSSGGPISSAYGGDPFDVGLAEEAPGRVLEAGTRHAIDYLGSTSLPDIRAAFEAGAGVATGGRIAAAAQMQASEAKIKKMYAELGMTPALLRRRSAMIRAAGNIEEADRHDALLAEFDDQLEKHKSNALIRKGAGGRALGHIGRVLDTTHREVTRRLTGPLLDEKRSITDSEPMGLEEWQDRIEKSDAPALKAITAGSRILGSPLGVVGGALGGGAGVVADLVMGNKPTAEGFMDAVKGGVDAGGEFVRSLATDPLTFASLGGGSLAKNLAGQGVRMAEVAGVKGAARAAFLADLEGALQVPGTALSASGKTSARAEAILAAADKHGIAPELSRKMFGETGELAGKAGFALDLPGTAKRLELSDALQGVGAQKAALAVETPLARAGRAISSQWEKAGGSRFASVNPVEQAVEAKLVGGKARMAQLTEGGDLELKSLAADAHAAGLNTPEAWDDLVRQTMDPAYDVQRLGANQAAPAGANIHSVFQPGNPQPIHYAVTPKGTTAGAGGYKPLGSLSKEKQAFANRWDMWMDRNYNDLVRVGAVDPNRKASNLLTGSYVPRRFKHLYDPAQEIVPQSGASMLRARDGDMLGGGKALGDEGVLPASHQGAVPGFFGSETNLMNVGSSYVRQHARAVARAEVVGDLAKSGLAKPLRDIKSADAHLWQAVDHQTAIPARYGRLVDETFNNPRFDIASAMRGAGAERTPAGRAMLGVLDWHRRNINTWKGNTLNWRPGYHVMNAVNDTQYLMAMGAANPLKWYRLARHGLTGKNTAVTLKNGQKTTVQALMREARAQNIGVGGVARTEAIGGGVKDTQRVLGRITEGKSAKNAISKVMDAPEAVSSAWSDTARTAGFILRRVLGDAPDVAGRAVREGMIDYSKQSLGLSIARMLMPFATFQYRAPKAALTHAVNSPRAITGTMRGLQAMAGDEKAGVEPREYWSERGMSFPMSPLQTKIGVDAPRSLAGGAPVPAEDQAFFLNRDSFTDPFQVPTQVASGNTDPLVNSLNPGLRMGLEGLMQKDKLTDQDMQLHLASPFNAGTPAWAGAAMGGFVGLQRGRSLGAGLAGAAVGAGLTAGDYLEAPPDSNTQGWLSRYYTPTPSPVTLGLNAAIRHRAGPTAGPPTVIGASRQYDARGGDPGSQLAGQGVSQVVGFPMYTASPLDQLYNLVNSDEMLRLGMSQEQVTRLRRQLEMLQAQRAR